MNPDRMNVESFNLDHRTVAAPYVRVADRKVLPHGDVITKYDVRFTQPNAAHLDMKAVHSLEHLFAESSRNHSQAVIDFSPMGCQTGYYLILAGEPDIAGVVDLIEATLTDVLQATEVPGSQRGAVRLGCQPFTGSRPGCRPGVPGAARRLGAGHRLSAVEASHHGGHGGGTCPVSPARRLRRRAGQGGQRRPPHGRHQRPHHAPGAERDRPGQRG